MNGDSKNLKKFQSLFQLILEINALDAVGDTSEDLVGDGVCDVAEHGDGQMLAEDLHLVALATIDACDINHRNIHTDITHILGLLTIHQTVAMTVAQVAVQAIGITDRYGSNHGVVVDLALATVADGIASRHVTHLKDSSL